MMVLDLLNEMSELVYIADLETYELLFMNKPGLEMFGITELNGQKCYKVLQGLDAPCEFCTNRLLNPCEFYAWNYTNPLNGRSYVLKDSIVDWNGRKARLEIAFDVTSYEEQRRALEITVQSENMLLECVKKLHRARVLEETVDEILADIGEYLDADRTYIFQIRDQLMFNTQEWCRKGVAPQIQNLQEMDVKLLDRWIPSFMNNSCVIIEDLETIKESSPDEYRELHVQGIHSLVAVPLEIKGKLLGYLGVDNPPKDKLENISNILNTLAYFLVTSLQRIEDEKEMRRLSYMDTLTGLYNRNRFIQDIESVEKKAETKPIGVVYVDINGLKEFNDRYGHAYGDEMIVKTVKLIMAAFPNECLYRVGGDEFVVISRLDRERFERGARDLKNLLSLEGECRASLGCSWSDQSSEIKNLITIADEKMYMDKKMFYHKHPHTGRYRHYNDDILGLTAPGVLEKEIGAGSFILYFQPKVSFVNCQMMGAEALIRYQKEDGRILTPDQFIPLLEDAGLISLIDLYAFEQVCRETQKWRSLGYRQVPVSVNFSRYTLMEFDFMNKLLAIWDQYDIPFKMVEIEVTEGGESDDNHKILLVLNEMKRHGFTVSIDDFGAKYANLSLFTEADFDVLKIDKSLVSNIVENEKCQILVKFMVQVCQQMNVTLIAEGVEDENQFEVLKNLGCQGAQGYLFSKPLPLADFEAGYLKRYDVTDAGAEK